MQEKRDIGKVHEKEGIEDDYEALGKERGEEGEKWGREGLKKRGR